jgi:hypothetical protein
MGDAFHVVAFADECDLDLSEHRSARRWTSAKQRLACCTVVQDGDEEGIWRLDRLPRPEEAAEIREILGIRKRLHYSAEEIARRVANLHKSGTLAENIAANGHDHPEEPSEPVASDD